MSSDDRVARMKQRHDDESVKGRYYLMHPAQRAAYERLGFVKPERAPLHARNTDAVIKPQDSQAQPARDDVAPVIQDDMSRCDCRSPSVLHECGLVSCVHHRICFGCGQYVPEQ